MQPLTISQLAQQIQSALAGQFPLPVPVVGEISEFNINRNGHGYLELVEHRGQSVAARIRGVVFANRLKLLQAYFESVTGRPLAAGLTVLVMAKVSHHPLYGLSAEISDIDPKYTLGDMERQKRMVIERLESEGVADMNRSLPFPRPVLRVAVVSSATAAGYGDFMNHLQGNPYGLRFRADLFPAYMQGAQAVESIADAFDRIMASGEGYDVAALIRGGGSKAELSVFDSYDLAFLVTQLPIPVLTGIGHDRDLSVTDMMANRALKTPTAVADLLVETNLGCLARLDELQGRIARGVERAVAAGLTRVERQKTRIRDMILGGSSGQHIALARAEARLQTAVANYFQARRNDIDKRQARLREAVAAAVLEQHKLLDIKQQRIDLLDPRGILERGFAVVARDGKRVKKASDLQVGDPARIYFASGSAQALVTRVDPPRD